MPSMYTFPLCTKGFSGFRFSQCNQQLRAHIPQSTIQLNNECKGKIGWTLAFFFFNLERVCVSSFISWWHQKLLYILLFLHYQCSAMAMMLERHTTVRCETAFVHKEAVGDYNKKNSHSLWNIYPFHHNFLPSIWRPHYELSLISVSQFHAGNICNHSLTSCIGKRQRDRKLSNSTQRHYILSEAENNNSLAGVNDFLKEKT